MNKFSFISPSVLVSLSLKKGVTVNFIGESVGHSARCLLTPSFLYLGVFICCLCTLIRAARVSFVIPTYCSLQPWQVSIYKTFLDLQVMGFCILNVRPVEVILIILHSCKKGHVPHLLSWHFWLPVLYSLSIDVNFALVSIFLRFFGCRVHFMYFVLFRTLSILSLLQSVSSVDLTVCPRLGFLGLLVETNGSVQFLFWPCRS